MSDSVEDVKRTDASVAGDQSNAQKAIDSEDVTVEEFKISGDDLGARIKSLIRQGNIRRIILKNEEGHVLIEIPLTVGVIGGAIGVTLFPVMAAVGVIGAMVAHITVVIERQV